MKIAILGTSGSGKSTLAQTLGQKYQIPVLHLDAVHFLPGWVERQPEDEQTIVCRFLEQHDSWIIDGNYHQLCYDRRLEEADRILALYFNRFTCLHRVIRRWQQNRGAVRSSAAPGCLEKLDAEFIWWVLYQGRRPAYRARIRRIGHQYPEKFVLIRNQRQLERFLASESFSS